MFAARPAYRIAWVILLSAVGLAGCQPKSEVAEAQALEQLNFTKLKAAHDARREKYHGELKAAKSDADAAEASKEFRKYWLAAIDETLNLAESQPSTSTGLDAAKWVISNCDSGYEPHIRAAELLLAHHPHPENLPGELYRDLTGDFHPVYERLLRLGAESNRSQQGKAYATFELADYLSMRADLKNAIDASPEDDAERIKNAGAQWLEHLKSTDSNQDRAEAKELYERVEHEYGDAAYRDRTLGELARERLLPFTQDYPEIGKPAPNIDATALDGNRLTLESLRGKVVVVSFWASWCGPCLARVPEENELVEEFADADFAFLGVNGDAAIEDARRAADEHSIRFDSCWDDPEADETIVARWGVTGWPTTFVLDKTGTIRFKNLSGPDLRRVVRQLLESDESDESSAEEKSPPRSPRPPR